MDYRAITLCVTVCKDDFDAPGSFPLLITCNNGRWRPYGFRRPKIGEKVRSTLHACSGNSINLFTNMLTLLLHFYHLQSESRFCVSRMYSGLYNTEVADF